ncbi:MAG: hypothetical protein ACYTHN_00695 [Planctomycetota bacterium]
MPGALLGYILIFLFPPFLFVTMILQPIFHILVDAYVFAFLYRIAMAARVGMEDPPPLPGFRDLSGDVWKPAVLTCVALFVSFWFPLLLAVSGAHWLVWMGVFLVAAGYFPMQYLAVTVTESYQGLHPLFVLNAIAKTGIPYARLAFAAAGAVGVSGLFFLFLWMAAPLFTWIAVHLLLLLFLLGYCKALGRFYHRFETILDWPKEEGEGE